MNYCSLDEAWGQPSVSHKQNIHKEHKKNFQKYNPINTPDLNYNCDFKENVPKTKTLSGYQNNLEIGYPINSKESSLKESSLKENSLKINENLDLFSFIKTLQLDDTTKNVLISKINSTIDSVKLESTSNDIREDFSNRYYKPSYNENRNIDILFLILLGLFIIFILDRK